MYILQRTEQNQKFKFCSIFLFCSRSRRYLEMEIESLQITKGCFVVGEYNHQVSNGRKEDSRDEEFSMGK